VQATMYGAHISHSGAAGIPAQKGLAVLWTSRISASTAAALAAVTCGNGGWVIWGIRGSRLAIKCV
jgi:hypothetical protein